MINLSPVDHIDDAAALWCDLERRAKHSFFLSWPWVRTWWLTVCDRIKPQLLTITENGIVIGAAFVVSRDLWRRGVLVAKTCVLNATGDPQLDGICIEYNGLLTDASRSAQAWQQLAEHFARADEDWEELQLQGVPAECLGFWSDPRVTLRAERVRTARHVDLALLRTAQTSFVKTLGKKTRAHIRHTGDAFAHYGEIKVEIAQTVDEALRYFEEMKILHQRRWTARGQPGAFSGGHFNRFHERLIADFFASNVIQLLRVTAGSRTVGILYNFIHNSDVLVYQTGFNYELVVSRNKESPGLLTHALAVDYNLSQGYARYDLLAGDSEYKRALAKESSELWWGTVQRDSFKFRVERLLQQVWWKLRVTFAWGAIAWVCDVPYPDLLLLA